MNKFEYKGYYTIVGYSAEDCVLYGKIEGISDLVSYESESLDVKEVEARFHEAVDDYLLFCKEENVEPDKPFKGSFNVRVSPEVHRRAWLEANNQKISLNQYVKGAIEEKLSVTQIPNQPQNVNYYNTIHINQTEPRGTKKLSNPHRLMNIFDDVSRTDLPFSISPAWTRVEDKVC